jgi:hypothetical protein
VTAAADFFDLFGEIPVTLEEVEHWLRTVPMLDPTTARAHTYAVAYDVIEKIRAAKVRGHWPRHFSKADTPPPGTLTEQLRELANGMRARQLERARNRAQAVAALAATKTRALRASSLPLR